MLSSRAGSFAGITRFLVLLLCLQTLQSTQAATAAAAPTFSPVGGTYTAAQTVTLSSTTSGALIRYTTDGSNAQ